MNRLCRKCKDAGGGVGVAAMPNVELCELHLKEQQWQTSTRDSDRRGPHHSDQPNTLDAHRPFTLEAEANRIYAVETALDGLDMATALRVLEYVRSRVVGGVKFR